jgi:hypothetical protein
LDASGAEKLLGKGDMLFTVAEMSKPKRLQGAFVSDYEIKKIVNYIKEKGGEPIYNESIIESQRVRGVAGVGLDSDDASDEMLEEAKELIINSEKASASFLQRRLSIGYARAARILDSLEEAGIVGPANGAKPREILISKEQYDNIINQGVSGVSLHNQEESEAPDNYLESEERNDNKEGNEEEKDDEKIEDEEEIIDDIYDKEKNNEIDESENNEIEENEEIIDDIDNNIENDYEDEDEEDDDGKYFSR